MLIIGRVLHNWDLATKLMLLRKAHGALPSAGALIVYERMIDDGRQTNAAGLLASLNMLIMTDGGFDYTPGPDGLDAGCRLPRSAQRARDKRVVDGCRD